MILEVDSPGLLTTVQDLGRWGYQGRGMPVAGAMDPQALKIGNILVGNPPEEAALEITLMGPTLRVRQGEGLVAVTGAEVDLAFNGTQVPLWQALKVREGDTIALTTSKGRGCRSYLCLSGGVDVPKIMGSKSTYLRAQVGGLKGRPLKGGDRITTGPLYPLTWRTVDFSCPDSLRPRRDFDLPLRVILGPQEEAFTKQGLETFLGSTYTITNEADRMGYRLDGPTIEHQSGADIISDAIPLGAIQVPGHGKPICMLADRQTTGGYTKIAVIATPDIGVLAQRLPGQTVVFQTVSLDEAFSLLKADRQRIEELLRLRASYRTRRIFSKGAIKEGANVHWKLHVGDKSYDVKIEEL